MPSELTLPPLPASVGRARRYVRERLEALGVSPADADAELLVSEIVTNAVVHAGTDITVRVRKDRAGARVEVADGNPNVPGPRRPRSRSHSGRGLLIVESLAPQWGVKSTASGKVVWFVVTQEG